MVRAAARRPLNILVLVVGAGIFAGTLAWWVPLLTLATYATAVFLAARDPFFQGKVLEGHERPVIAPRSAPDDISPERRARWLPRGEARQKVEAALVVYRKVVGSIEESDDVTRAVLEGAVPKLHAAADRLVDVARGREEAAQAVADLRSATTAPTESRARQQNMESLEERIRAADAEISDTFESLLDLRAKVVRVSLESGDPARAATLNASLDELNARLEALSETMSPRGDHGGHQS